jgi:hypothetical protein
MQGFKMIQWIAGLAGHHAKISIYSLESHLDPVAQTKI